ncbi:MAG: PqqD family protein [Clostridia bacterium]|nr:PqqD family protein [Clostridia bacterium]
MKIKEGFVIEKVGASYLAVATGKMADEFHALVRLNSTGAFLWHKLTESSRTEEELLSLMLDEYDVTREQASADISAFLESLKRAGILDA